MPYIEARGLRFTYPGVGEVLRGVDLQAGPGEIVAIAGPTGCGKSTLLLLLAGLLEPEQGQVLLDSRPVGPWARRRIGLLFQNPDDQLFNPTVKEEIAYALRSLRLPEDEVVARVERIAKRLGISGLLDKQPYRLSVGQRKLVALASILVYEPDVLLLDEPAANLDKRSLAALTRIVREHAAGGGTAVLATHSLDLVLELSTKLCLMRGGRLSCSGTEEAVAEGLLEEAPLHVPLALRLLRDMLGGWRSVAKALKQAQH